MAFDRTSSCGISAVLEIAMNTTKFLTIAVVVLVLFLVLRTFTSASLNLSGGASTSGDV